MIMSGWLQVGGIRGSGGAWYELAGGQAGHRTGWHSMPPPPASAASPGQHRVAILHQHLDHGAADLGLNLLQSTGREGSVPAMSKMKGEWGEGEGGGSARHLVPPWCSALAAGLPPPYKYRNKQGPR